MRRPTVRSEPTHAGALLTSVEMKRAREDASAAALAQRAQTGSPYVGFVYRRSAGPSPDGAAALVHDTAEVRSFTSEAEMWRWFHGVIAYPRGYDFAALFDATSPTWPASITEDAPGLS